MGNDRQPCVYIFASQKNGTLYIGVTSNLIQRVHQHKHNVFKGFSEKYNVYRLVYYELHGTMYAALTREKQIKKWKRQWKIELIEQGNKDWRDLHCELIEVC